MADDDQRVVEIDYTNHRGERRWRRIIPWSMDFDKSPFHPEEQWLLFAHDLEKSDNRFFAMKNIHEWRIPD